MKLPRNNVLPKGCTWKSDSDIYIFNREGEIRLFPDNTIGRTHTTHTFSYTHSHKHSYLLTVKLVFQHMLESSMLSLFPIETAFYIWCKTATINFWLITEVST